MADHVMLLDNCIWEDGWQVGCSCGWGEDVRYDGEAECVDAWENHCDVVFMEATTRGL